MTLTQNHPILPVLSSAISNTFISLLFVCVACQINEFVQRSFKCIFCVESSVERDLDCVPE